MDLTLLFGARDMLYAAVRDDPPTTRQCIVITLACLIFFGGTVAANAIMFDAAKNHLFIPVEEYKEFQPENGIVGQKYIESIEAMRTHSILDFATSLAPWPALVFIWISLGIIAGGIELLVIGSILYLILWSLGQRPGYNIFLKLSCSLLPVATAAALIVTFVNAVTYLIVADISIANMFVMYNIVWLIYLGLIAEGLVSAFETDRFRTLIAMVPYTVVICFSILALVYFNFYFMDYVVTDTLHNRGVLP